MRLRARVLYRLSAAIAAVLATGSWQPAAAATDPREARFLFSESASPPPDDAGWQTVALPDKWGQRRPDARGSAWYRITFTVPTAPAEPWMVYLPTFRDGGQVFVNGRLVASVRQADADNYVRWLLPQAFRVAPSLLSEGPNSLDVHVSVSEPAHTMYVPTIGPEAEVRPIYEKRRFWSYTTAQLTVVATLTVGLFVLVIWVRRRMAFDYGLFGVAAVCWGLRTLSIVVSVYPMAIWHPWRVVHYAATGGFVVAMTMFILRFAGMRNPLAERLLIAYWLTGPLLLALGGPAWHDFVDKVYQAGLIPVAMMMLAAAAWGVWRLRTAGALALCGGVTVSFALGVHDYLVSRQLLPNERGYIYLMHLGANVLLLVIGALLADRFVRGLREVERSAGMLESKVRERERELAENYERLSRLERERTAVEERQRIMQDMHDGLGSQLLSSLAMVERGALDREGMAQALRDAIDDMRLAIDALAPGHEGIVEALANLAWRLEPRFRAAGIELRFDLTTMPDRLGIPVDASLQILRILQEALANALKHSGAHSVRVEVSMLENPARLQLAVRDDGSGFDATRAWPRGRGLGGMQRRAERIGAALTVASGADGTRLALTHPIGPVG